MLQKASRNCTNQGQPVHAPTVKIGAVQALTDADQNCMRGAMAIAISSWNSSLHAYGMCTCAQQSVCQPRGQVSARRACLVDILSSLAGCLHPRWERHD